MVKMQPELIEEQLLWEVFLSGDKKVYSYFYKKYVEKLFAYGMQFTSNRELVKDCIQDVFVKIYNNRSNLNKTTHVKAYLFLALKNTLFNFFEKEKIHYCIDTMEPVFYTEYTIEDRMIADEQENEWKNKVNHLLEMLTPRQREVIYYRYMEGMELKDICELMGMNYQSVHNLIQRSIKKMKSVLAKKTNRIFINVPLSRFR